MSLVRQAYQIEENKLRTILEWELPTTGAGLQSFLGLITFVRHHVRHIADLTAPLEAIKYQRTIQWDEQARESFDVVKHAFASAPLLNYPDLIKHFILLVMHPIQVWAEYCTNLVRVTMKLLRLISWRSVHRS